MRNILRKKRRIPILLPAFLAAVLISAVLSACGKPVGAEPPRVENGIMDLRDWSLGSDGNIKLDGNWEFYWNQLIPPGGFGESRAKLTGYYPVPKYWTKYKGLDLPSRGYATYRILIDTNGGTQPLSIKTPEIYTEYSLWVNGRLIDGNGSFAGRPVRYLRPDIYTFDVNSPTIELVLQMKNYAHKNAGIGQSFILGVPEYVNKARNAKAAVDVLFFAVCFFAGLYHAILYFFRKKERELLYFVALCIAVSIRSILSNETWLMQFFPDLPFEIGSRVLTTTIPACMVSMLLYTRELYKEEMPVIVVNILLGFSGLYELLIIAAPTFIYSSLFNYYLITVDVLFVTGIYCSIKSIRKGRRESAIFLAGAVLLGIGAFNDMLYYNQLLDTGYYLSLGLMAFVVIQAIVLAVRYSNAYRAIERLSENLRASMEQTTAAETAFLQAQIKPHFLYNALNTIADCCETDSQEAGKLILSLAKYLRGTLDFENVGGIISLKKELELVKAYTTIEKARFDNLQVKTEVEDGLLDIQLPPLTIQPLVENAIKHGIRKKTEGGTVLIRIHTDGGDAVFSVEDNGAGMEAGKAEELLNTPRGGASVGIYNIHTRLVRKYGRGLAIKSVPGRGTAVGFIIPDGREPEC